jgi:hypothetical protein
MGWTSTVTIKELVPITSDLHVTLRRDFMSEAVYKKQMDQHRFLMYQYSKKQYKTLKHKCRSQQKARANQYKQGPLKQ